MQSSQHKLIIRAGVSNLPNNFELNTGYILAKYFNSNIEYIPSGNLYRPDILISRLGQQWEIKTPKGNSKNTIHHTLSQIELQSENVVISLLNTKMAPKIAIGRIKIELKHPNHIKRLLLVTKQGKVVEIKG